MVVEVKEVIEVLRVEEVQQKEEVKTLSNSGRAELSNRSKWSLGKKYKD